MAEPVEVIVPDVIDPPQDFLWEVISRDNFPLLHGDMVYFLEEFRDKGDEEEWFHAFLDKYPLHFPSREGMGYSRRSVLAARGWYDRSFFRDEKYSELRRSKAPCEFYGEWDRVVIETCGDKGGEILELTTHMSELQTEINKVRDALPAREKNEIRDIMRKLPRERRRAFMLRRFGHLYCDSQRDDSYALDRDSVELIILTAKFYEEMRNKGYNHLDLVL